MYKSHLNEKFFEMGNTFDDFFVLQDRFANQFGQNDNKEDTMHHPECLQSIFKSKRVTLDKQETDFLFGKTKGAVSKAYQKF